jgi:hypothetical protein
LGIQGSTSKFSPLFFISGGIFSCLDFIGLLFFGCATLYFFSDPEKYFPLKLGKKIFYRHIYKCKLIEGFFDAKYENQNHK